jgi:phosphosulfolactate phosphohydrolase-like enzyme
MNIDAIFSPKELPALAGRDLRETVCVVFDVLRATSTFVTALNNGAREIIPVSEISEALELKKIAPFCRHAFRSARRLRPAISFSLHADEIEIAFA